MSAARPLLLDLFSGAGGAAMGYYRAGFDVVGVDIVPQPHYPFRFIRANALDYVVAHGCEYDVIHASPPCQRYSQCTPPQYRQNHPDLIASTRQILLTIEKPYVIENVPAAAPLLWRPIMLCSSMFDLPMERHRYFELSWTFKPAWEDRLYCRHIKTPVLVTGVTRRKDEPRRENSAAECREAMDIGWMTRAELDEAIPPAYTEYIGRQMLRLFAADPPPGATPLALDREARP